MNMIRNTDLDFNVVIHAKKILVGEQREDNIMRLPLVKEQW